MVEIKFGTGNAAFWIDYEMEEFDYAYAAEVIHEVADKIAQGYEDGNIRDICGNRIGTFKVDC